MRACITFFTLWLTYLALAKAEDSKVVCYYGSWAVYRIGNGNLAISDIDPTLCTHLIYSFVGISNAGEVRVLDPWIDVTENGGRGGFNKFNALRERSPETKTLVAIGGWNEGSEKYSVVAANPTLRSTFVKNVVDFVLRYGFDGFDVDWEYPAQRGGGRTDVQNYVLLLKELREAFDKNGLILSAAVAAPENLASLSYDIAEISKYLDFINLMTYDYHGSWDQTASHNAPLYAAARERTEAELYLNIDATVRYWLSQGAPPEKLVLGTGFYGRSFTLSNPAQNVPGSPVTGAGNPGPYTQESGMLGYNELCEFQKQGGWTTAWDDEQHVAYAYSGNQWVSYDSVKSVTEKAEYVKALGLGGAMVWSIETDDFGGICGEKFPLLNALNAVLRGGVTSGSVPTSKPPTSDDIEGDTDSDVVVPPSNPITETPEDAEEQNLPESPETEIEVEGDSDEISDAICTSAGLVKNVQDCTKFWYCVQNGEVFVANALSCPAGLYFDTTIQACNYANLVEC